MFLIFRRQGRPLCDVTGFVIIGWSIELGFAGGSLGCNKDMSYFWHKVDIERQLTLISKGSL